MLGLNYLEFQAAADVSGTLAFTLSSPLTGRNPFQNEGDLNGFQLVGPSVPEPSFTGIVGCLLLVLSLNRYRSGRE